MQLRVVEDYQRVLLDKILVIEDDPYVLDNIYEILNLEGYHVYKSDNGREGLEMANRYLPDLILSDIMMPEMNGYEVLEELKKNSTTIDIPFIFLTAKAGKDENRLGMILGADDYLTKPYNISDIIKTVKARLNRHKKILDSSNVKMDELRSSIALSLPHEFRTPLNIISSFVQNLKTNIKKMPDDDVNSMLDDIYDSSQRLHRLMLNYLLYAKLIETEYGKYSNNIIPVSKYPEMTIYEQAMISSNSAGRPDDLNLDLQNAPIKISESHFIKVVEELLDNGFKFSLPSTRVTVTSEIVDNQYILKIHNYGRGMSKIQISHIGAYIQFDREKYEQQGTGLGLAIVKKLADVYEGSLTFESVPGNGITAIFMINIVEEEKPDKI